MSSQRADRVAAEIAQRELDCLLVTDAVDVRYLTGFTGSNGACLIFADERLFITDFRYIGQAEAQVEGYEHLPAGRELASDLAERLRGRSGFDDAKTSVRAHGKLSEKVGSETELVAAGGLVEGLRQVKDPSELRAIAASQELATAALERTLESGLRGRTEREFAQSLEQAMREAGASGPSFASIVAAGGHGALPHAEPRDVEIPGGTLVVVDWGAELDGYCSDCTRTFATGPLDDGQLAAYEAVLDAQQQALAAVREGAGTRAVDAVARDALTAAGYGENFGHSLGHGVGLEIHEEPRLSKTGEGDLVAGNVVTVEPGVYLPGELGVRIEDLVAVTETGSDVFTSFPKSLVTVD